MPRDAEQRGRRIHSGDYRRQQQQHEYRQANQDAGTQTACASKLTPTTKPAPQAAATQYQTHQTMIAPRQKILIKQRHQSRPATLVAALLWPLVICSLLQLSANLLYIINEGSGGAGLDYPSHLLTDRLLGVEDGRANTGCSLQPASPAPARHQKLSSSSTSKISSPATTTTLYSQDITQHQQLSPPSTTWKLVQLSFSKFFNTLTTSHWPHGRSIWGGKVLMAQAISLYQANQDKGIIILNSSNLYPELLQTRHPFPHIKLIEYYVSYCGVCARFKTTYTKLAKAIHPWRNVMRPSAIDLGASNNSPVALAWTIRVIPALTINPPPDTSVAQKLDRQLSNWSTTMQPIELHRSMFDQYNSSHLFVQTLNVSRYMDKTDLLKADLLLHIENYVRTNTANLPTTWPNLRPVTETTLASLQRNHPRQELFLLIEGGSASVNQSTSSAQPNLGLSIILELSASAPWKSIRYMRANENKALLEDVMVEQKRACELSGATSGSCTEQVELLNNLLSNKPIGANDMLLIHVDGSHGTPKRAGGLTSSAFPLIKLITGTELSNMEQSGLLGQKHENSNVDRAKRAINHLTRKTRSLFDSGNPSAGFDKMSSERTVELLVQYINLTYVETTEDRNFLNAINNLINDNVGQAQEDTIDGKLSGAAPPSEQTGSELTTTQSSLMTHIYDMLNIRDRNQQTHQTTTTTPNYSFPHDYEDKLKAIRYMLFSEIPRSSLHADKNSQDQQDRLNILINLVSVIKSYFPLPDASSIQFIAGVHAYLIKQARLTSITNQGRISGGGSFDVSAYKQELKRLEWENKRLPEVKEYKLCVNSGYPCALWRLFHTLAAFEYKKLSEIRRQAATAASSSHLHSSASLLQQQPHPDTSFPPSASSSSEVITTMKSPPTSSSHDADGGLPSPVERLVSPPSTTTSLSLTIATPTSSSQQQQASETSSNNRLLNEADLPTPVLLVMRDYITTFFSCEECRRNFRTEAADLSLERIRQQEPAEFSVMWLWDVHNRVSKRLAMEPASVATESSPKVWFPTYAQCVACYKRPPSFQQMLPAVDQVTMFQESIEWNTREVLSFLTHEYLKDPLDKSSCGLFENHLLYIGLLAAISCSCLLFMLVHRCTAIYLERQRRHKANILNGNGAHTYSLALNE